MEQDHLKRTTFVFWMILVLGAAIRAYGVTAFPFEQDELYTVDEATNLFQTRLAPGIQARPVFFLLEHPLVTTLPHTPLVLRCLPFLFGLLGLWATWKLARHVLGDVGGWVAVLLAAISPWHMYASGFGRYYSLIYLLAALVYWWLPRAYDSDRPRDFLFAFGALFVGMWTHPSFIIPVAGAAVAATVLSREGRIGWRWPTRNAMQYLWLPFFLGSGGVFLALKFTHHMSAVVNGGDRGLAATLRLLPAMVDWMTATVFVAGAAGALLLMTSRTPGRRRFGGMALLGVSGMLLALLALSFFTSVYADYGIAALPLVFVTSAAVVQWIADGIELPRRRGAVAAVVALLVVGVLPSTLSHLSDGTRFDYRPAFARIAADPPEAVLAWPVVLQRAYAPQFHAYELRPDSVRLDSILTRERHAWAVVSVKRYGVVGDDGGQIASWLGGHCVQVDSYQRPRLDYRMYRVDLWRCSAGTEGT